MIINFPELAIRPAEDADDCPVTELVHECWHEIYAPHLPSQLSRRHTREQTARLLAARSSMRWVATQGPRLVGYCAVLGNCIDQLWVGATYRRRGIGSRLMEQALGGLARRKYQTAQAGCEDFNTGFRHFLQHRGWRLIGAETQELTPDDRVTALVYSVDLMARQGTEERGRAAVPQGG